MQIGLSDGESHPGHIALSRPRLLLAATMAMGLGAAVLTTSRITYAKPAMQTDDCRTGHCYAVRSRVYTGDGTTIISATGVLERPDPQIDTSISRPGFSTIPVWIANNNSRQWLEIGIIKGDGETIPCVGCDPYPVVPTIYSYCGGCGVTVGTEFGNHGLPGRRTKFRINRVSSGVSSDDVWTWELCRSGTCAESSSAGWQEVRRDSVDPETYTTLIAGGEVYGTSDNVLGVAGLLGIRRGLSGGCGGLTGIKCADLFVPSSTTYEILHGPPPSSPKYRSVYTSAYIQVRTTCHVDGIGCP